MGSSPGRGLSQRLTSPPPHDKQNKEYTGHGLRFLSLFCFNPKKQV